VKRIPIRVVLLLFTVCCLVAGASQKPAAETEPKLKERSAEVPKAEQSATQHKITVGGATISYKPSLKRFKEDVARFIDATDRL